MGLGRNVVFVRVLVTSLHGCVDIGFDGNVFQNDLPAVTKELVSEESRSRIGLGLGSRWPEIKGVSWKNRKHLNHGRLSN